jgi:hypothetical protein
MIAQRVFQYRANPMSSTGDPFKALHRYDLRKAHAIEREFEKVLRKIRGQRPICGAPLPPKYSMGTAMLPAGSGIESWIADADLERCNSS